MPFIELSQIAPSQETIVVPSSVKLGFNLKAAKGTPVLVYYQLNTDNNIYFKLSNGNLVKEIVQKLKMPAAVKSFADNVFITKIEVPPAQDHSYCYIYVQAVNTLNELSDIKHCLINL